MGWGGSNREVSEDSQQGWQWRITVTAATHVCKHLSSCWFLHPCVRPPHWPMYRVSSSFKDWKLQTVGVKRLGPALSYPEFQKQEVDLHLCSPNPISSEQSMVDWDAMGKWDVSIIHPSQKYFFLDNQGEAIDWITAWVTCVSASDDASDCVKHLYLGCFLVGKVRPHPDLQRGSQSQSIVPPCFAVGVSLLELGSLSVLNSTSRYIIVIGDLDFLSGVTYPGTPVAWLLMTLSHLPLGISHFKNTAHSFLEWLFYCKVQCLNERN